MATTLVPRNKVSKLELIMDQLKQGTDNTDVKKKVADYLEHTTEEELWQVMDELVREGVDAYRLQRLCDIHSELDASVTRIAGVELQKNHPLGTFLDQHERILDQLDLLALISEQIYEAHGYQSVKEELEKIREVSNRLLKIGKHFAREELLLFPQFGKTDLSDPSPILKFEHQKGSKLIERLSDLLREAPDMDFPVFSKSLLRLSDQLMALLKRHIYSENSIFYPLAAATVTNENWEETKEPEKSPILRIEVSRQEVYI